MSFWNEDKANTLCLCTKYKLLFKAFRVHLTIDGHVIIDTVFAFIVG